MDRKVNRAQFEYHRELETAKMMIWYDKAHNFELNALRPYGIYSILMIGTGPYPTTAIEYAKAGYRISCIEKEAEAIALAKQLELINCVDLEFIHADAMEMTDFSGYDCIFIGLVVGPTDKDRVVEHFMQHVDPWQRMVFRTAYGHGTDIFPSVDLGLLYPRRYKLIEDPPHKDFTIVIVEPEQ